MLVVLHHVASCRRKLLCATLLVAALASTDYSILSVASWTVSTLGFFVLYSSTQLVLIPTFCLSTCNL
jgi:hypothetical protein